MRGLISTIPFFVPFLAISICLGLLLARPLARRLATHAGIAFLLVVSVGLVVGVTLTPHVDPFSDETAAAGFCDLSRVGLISVRQVFGVNEASLNVLLFVPLGLALGVLPATSARRALLIGAVVLPFAVEATQALAPVLGRGCESADVFDNLLGLAIGLAVGVSARFVAHRPGTSQDGQA